MKASESTNRHISLGSSSSSAAKHAARSPGGLSQIHRTRQATYLNFRHDPCVCPYIVCSHVLVLVYANGEGAWQQTSIGIGGTK
eukprot:scaffold681505_cov69-Prasinocladus_malaysianus.AAC.1